VSVILVRKGSREYENIIRTSNSWGTALVSNLLVTNGDGWRVDLPETRLRVDRNSGERALGLGHIDTAKLVSTSGVVLEIDREDRHGELRHDAVEEGSLFLGLDGVKLAECKSNKTIVVGVTRE
jgi:hypothetical protein